MVENKFQYIHNVKKAFNMKCFMYLFVIGLLFVQSGFAQNEVSEDQLQQQISLNEILKIASEQSLDMFRAKHNYGTNYWQFKSYESSILPKIDFSLAPLTYNRALVERYDSEENIDVYREQQTVNSYANLYLSQNIRVTGGTVYLNSSFNRLMNFGETDVLNFNVTPIQIGFSQPILAYNEFKWEHKTAPIRFEKAKKEYIQELQILKSKAVNLFFNWALATNRVSIAKENVESAEKMFKIGARRYKIGSLEKDDILNLELEVFNSKTNLTKVEKGYEKAAVDIMIFLRKDTWHYEEPALPELILNLKIDVEKAHKFAKTNNPNLLNLRLLEVEGERDLDRAIKENRFDLSLMASYGLNQQSETLDDAYKDFLDQEMIAIQFNIPLLDWGERRGNIKMAKSKREVLNIEIEQESEKLRQEISLKVIDFNLQEQLVLGDLKSKEISRESYEVTQKRFLSGRVDLLKLTSARKVWQNASESYIQSLFNYWKFYYEVQQLTLYDFMKNQTLDENFDKIINN